MINLNPAKNIHNKQFYVDYKRSTDDTITPIVKEAKRFRLKGNRNSPMYITKLVDYEQTFDKSIVPFIGALNLSTNCSGIYEPLSCFLTRFEEIE